MDISADLLELSRTPVTVVCAGIKSILDIPKSLEVLETNSVPVLSYGTSVFPAFYTNDSGIPSPRSVHNTADIASIMGYQRLLRLDSGILVAVPNPSPANGDKIQYAINFALTSAKNEGISGAKVTPYVLDKVQQLTGGESLESNIALVMNNARIAAEIAVDYANLLGQNEEVRRSAREEKIYMSGAVSNGNATAHLPPRATASVPPPPESAAASKSAEVSVEATSKPPAVAATSSEAAPAPAVSSSHPGKPDILVVGGAVVDLIGHIGTLTKYHTSNPGQLSISHGGVGRNIAESLARLGRNVSLATAVADDINGRSILDSGKTTGIDMSLVKVLRSGSGAQSKTTSDASGSTTGAPARPAPHATAMYNAIHDNTGDLCIGVADMSIFAQISPEYVTSLAQSISTSAVVAVDGNISKEAFAALVDICAHYNVPVFFEPTSDHKCLLPFQAGRMHKVRTDLCHDDDFFSVCVHLSFAHENLKSALICVTHCLVLLQVSLLKPNVSELVQMVSHCLSAGQINSGRALVQSTLGTIAGDRIDQANMQHMEISDVRILLNALYQVMHSVPGAQGAAVPPKSGFLSGFLKSDAPAVKPTVPVDGSAKTDSAPSSAITGKHIIVSLGSRGLVWCGPAKQLTAIPAGAAAPKYLKDGSCVVNEATQSATIVIPSMVVNPADIVHTNGAGDALCAGLLAEIVRKYNASTEAVGVTAALPDMECVHKGLFSAHHWLVSK
jgi:sugar/nucleoside kinase (ribokinase family)